MFDRIMDRFIGTWGALYFIAASFLMTLPFAKGFDRMLERQVAFRDIGSFYSIAFLVWLLFETFLPRDVTGEVSRRGVRYMLAVSAGVGAGMVPGYLGMASISWRTVVFVELVLLIFLLAALLRPHHVMKG